MLHKVATGTFDCRLYGVCESESDSSGHCSNAGNQRVYEREGKDRRPSLGR